jgi:hypothetical protein
VELVHVLFGVEGVQILEVGVEEVVEALVEVACLVSSCVVKVADVVIILLVADDLIALVAHLVVVHLRVALLGRQPVLEGILGHLVLLVLVDVPILGALGVCCAGADSKVVSDTLKGRQLDAAVLAHLILAEDVLL